MHGDQNITFRIFNAKVTKQKKHLKTEEVAQKTFLEQHVIWLGFNINLHVHGVHLCFDLSILSFVTSHIMIIIIYSSFVSLLQSSSSATLHMFFTLCQISLAQRSFRHYDHFTCCLFSNSSLIGDLMQLHVS